MNYYGDPTMNPMSSQSDEQGQTGGYEMESQQENQTPSMSTMTSQMPSQQMQYQAPSQPTPQSIPSIPHYSHGGEVYKKGLEDVYMNPQEISIMDTLQGDKHNYDRDGVKNYTKLWHMINNPHLMKAGWEGHYKDLYRKHHAHGGQIDDAPEGRFGDTKRVRMPKKMADMFDHILKQTGKHPSRNPKTGHREYFGLGGFFNGIGQQIGANIPPSPSQPVSNPMGGAQMGSAPMGGSQMPNQFGSNPMRPRFMPTTSPLVNMMRNIDRHTRMPNSMSRPSNLSNMRNPLPSSQLLNQTPSPYSGQMPDQ